MELQSHRRQLFGSRPIWLASVLLVLGLTAVWAVGELENPWIDLIILGVLGFVLLVPKFAGGVIAHQVQLARSINWWQGLLLVMLVSGLVFRARTASEINRSPVDGLAIFRIGCVSLVAGVLLLRLTLRKTNWLRFLFSGLIGIFALYGFISLVSAVWSLNPPWTLYKSVELLTDVTVVAGIVATLESVEEYKKFVNWTWILLGLLIACAWAGAVVDPADALFASAGMSSAAVPIRLQGVMPVVSSNDLSDISAILALVSLCRLCMDPSANASKKWYWLLFAVSFITLLITQTRGAYAAFVLGLVLLLLFARRYWVVATGGIFASGIAVVLLTFTNFATNLQKFLLRGETAEAAGGLSGRFVVWQLSIHKIMEKPLIGYGGFAGARFAVLTKNTTWSDALNLYIDSMLNVGVLGTVLLVLLIGLVGWNLFRTVYVSSEQSQICLAMELSLAFTILAIRSMESGAIITHPMLSFLVLLGVAEFLRRRGKMGSVQVIEGPLS